MTQQKQISVDADGTIFLHDFPFIVKEAPHAIRVLRRIQDADHTLILHTMRDGDELADAKRWLKNNGLIFEYFNENPTFETGSRKVYSHYSIDDHNVGCPLIHDPLIHQKPFVDWLEIEKIFEEKGLI